VPPESARTSSFLVLLPLRPRPQHANASKRSLHGKYLLVSSKQYRARSRGSNKDTSGCPWSGDKTKKRRRNARGGERRKQGHKVRAEEPRSISLYCPLQFIYQNYRNLFTKPRSDSRLAKLPFPHTPLPPSRPSRPPCGG